MTALQIAGTIIGIVAGLASLVLTLTKLASPKKEEADAPSQNWTIVFFPVLIVVLLTGLVLGVLLSRNSQQPIASSGTPSGSEHKTPQDSAPIKKPPSSADLPAQPRPSGGPDTSRPSAETIERVLPKEKDVDNGKSTPSVASLDLPVKVVPPAKKDDAKRPDKIIHSSVGMKLVYIPAGTFRMGSPASEGGRKADEVQHEVQISSPFYLGMHEVTQAEYRWVTGQNPSWDSSTGGGRKRVGNRDTNDWSVEFVTWHEAIRFCNLLSQKEVLDPYYEVKGTAVTVKSGIGYRLPTEAEWEYACRGGTSSPFFFGEDESLLDQYANYVYRRAPFEVLGHPIGKRKPNPFGLYDMYGNVFEWCWDRYGSYASSKQVDPAGPDSGQQRVVRGGGGGGETKDVRSAARDKQLPTFKNSNLGLRVARTCP